MGKEEGQVGGGGGFLMNLKHEFEAKDGGLNGTVVSLIDLGLAPGTLPCGKI
jgi:hypothetical protein